MHNLFERYLLYSEYYVSFSGNCSNEGGETEVVWRGIGGKEGYFSQKWQPFLIQTGSGKEFPRFEKLWRIWASTIHGGKQDFVRKTQNAKQWLHHQLSCCWEQSWPSLLLCKANSERCGNDSTWWQGKSNFVYISTLVILTFKQHMLIFSYYGSKYIVHTGILPKIFR